MKQTFPGCLLNPRYTFESFVTGPCNEAAVQVAKEIAKAPAAKYNPVYIYGPTGIGKTHLLHAIANYLVLNQPSINILFATSEVIQESLLEEIRNRDKYDFINQFKSIDVIFIDDLHYFYQKRRTQEELLYAFKSFIKSYKQLVFTASYPPAMLSELKLKTFEKSKLVAINELHMDTKLAILRNKAKEKQFLLSDDILFVLANKYINDAFELEGILNRLVAITSLNNAPITPEVLEMACKPILKDRLESLK